MSGNSQRPPEWWKHSAQAWIDLSGFFTTEQLFRDAYWRRLSQGQSNYNYQLTILNQDYFVQLVNTANIELLPQRRVGQQLNLQNLSAYPTLRSWLVECYLDTPSVRVFEWHQAENSTARLFATSFSEKSKPSQIRFAQSSFLSSLTEFLSQLHSVEISPPQQKQLPVIDIRQHLKRYQNLAFNRSPQYSKQIEMAYQEAQLMAHDFVSSKLCHNDLSINNLLWSNSDSRLKVIDWEYACVSDPIMDIAGLLLNLPLSNRQQQQLIEGYSANLNITIAAAKLTQMKQLCRNISALWQFASQLT